jgi:hypothetical protein
MSTPVTQPGLEGSSSLIDLIKIPTVDGPSEIVPNLNDFCTPDPICSNYSDCHVVGNKWPSLVEDESNHSKWEEFRRMAKMDSSHDECSQLLRKMELQDSDEEMEIQE